MNISVKKDIGLGVKDSYPISVSIRIPKQEEISKEPKITIPVVQEKQEIPNKEIIQLPEIIEPPKQTYSIIDKINTGFGCDNALHKDCPKPQWHQHLCKENFLGEFKTELEKQLARDNLDIYSKTQINKFIKDLSGVDLSSYITKDYFNEAIQNLDYVKSFLKSNIDYNIPENLFTL